MIPCKTRVWTSLLVTLLLWTVPVSAELLANQVVVLTNRNSPDSLAVA